MQTEAAVLGPVRLEIYRHLFTALTEEMGAALRRAAYSPNIKERRDYSCAVFDGAGGVVAVGDHMPVHLGAMPMSVAAVIEALGALDPGDVAAVNDPYRGGTHLPDVTLVAPVFGDEGAAASGGEAASVGATPVEGAAASGGVGTSVSAGKSRGSEVDGAANPGAGGDRSGPLAYLASRAHHADVGGMTPGSMPLAREIFQEGLRIPPLRLMRGNDRVDDVWSMILANVRTPVERAGDLDAQVAALRTGERRLLELAERRGAGEVREAMRSLSAYAERLVRAGIARVPDGEYTGEDVIEGDGRGGGPFPIRVKLRISGDELEVDFTGTAAQAAGGVNAVAAITTSAVRYVVRCVIESLLNEPLPAGGGAMPNVETVIPAGSLVGAEPPASVAGGNVETSQRITDVLLLAFSEALPDVIPAQSQGTMNNLTVGGRDPRTGEPFAYYETVAGGMGAGPSTNGLSGVHVHMSNSLNTPIEALEHAYPFRIRRYRLRRGTGGAGLHAGGDGVRRDLELLTDAEVTLLTRSEEPHV